MKNHIKTLAVLAALVVGASAQASITEADGLGSVWLGTPTYLVAAGATAASFTVNEGNFGSTGGSGGFGALSQSFTLNSSQAGTLTSIQMVFGGAVNTFNVALYDLGAYPVSGYPATSASYTPGNYVNLLAGDSFTYNAGAAGAASVVRLTFTGADASLVLNAGDLYVFQIDPTSSAGTVWYRGNLGGPGEMYRMNQFTANQMGALNGATRDASFALTTTPVPEPATMALMGLGALGALLIRRRK